MLLVGLTGGIGSGKSTVAGMLEARGAIVFNADAFARAGVEAGTPGFDAVVARFGNRVVGPVGRLDRKQLADIVFADDTARADLESIVHPEVRRALVEAIHPYLETDRIVVLDSPLLIETGQQGYVGLVIVVSAPVDAQIARVGAERGMSEEEARARIAAQMPLEEKAEVADIVLDNDGTLDELEHQVDRLWPALVERAGGSGA
jgi:dephospho-CoA kinase